MFVPHFQPVFYILTGISLFHTHKFYGDNLLIQLFFFWKVNFFGLNIKNTQNNPIHQNICQFFFHSQFNFTPFNRGLQWTGEREKQKKTQREWKPIQYNEILFLLVTLREIDIHPKHTTLNL